MGLAFYLINYNWFFVILVWLAAGFITSIVFMVIWDMLFRGINLEDSCRNSCKMSIVSMLIMMLAENMILLYIVPKFLSHQMAMAGQPLMHMQQSFIVMAIAMASGFLLSLPYNYYQLQKTGKLCH